MTEKRKDPIAQFAGLQKQLREAMKPIADMQRELQKAMKPYADIQKHMRAIAFCHFSDAVRQATLPWKASGWPSI